MGEFCWEQKLLIPKARGGVTSYWLGPVVKEAEIQLQTVT